MEGLIAGISLIPYAQNHKFFSRADRRTFLKSLAGVTAGLFLAINTSGKESNTIGELLPMRKFDRTGAYVTMPGAAGFHIGLTTERDTQEVIEAGLKAPFASLIPQKVIHREKAKRGMTKKSRDLCPGIKTKPN
jgi:hypothetical protein